MRTMMRGSVNVVRAARKRGVRARESGLNSGLVSPSGDYALELEEPEPIGEKDDNSLSSPMLARESSLSSANDAEAARQKNQDLFRRVWNTMCHDMRMDDLLTYRARL